MPRPVAVAVAILAALAAIAATRAPAGGRTERVPVRPRVGSRDTTFRLSFRTADRTGLHGSVQRHDLVRGAASAVGHGCLGAFAVRAPDARAGAVVRVALRPLKLGGRWCPGSYRGRIEERQTAACRPGERCPAYVRLRAVIGVFSFRVTRASSPPGTGTAPPSFAGLQSAFACTPGPQRPGQTTPFTLSWQPASDGATPSSQIVYDIYLASAPGGEDYATPTWTTPPGATSFRTPGLAPHGTFYFVVRARDQAGREDRNTVERRGSDPCY